MSYMENRLNKEMSFSKLISISDSALFIARKSEKISSAIYIITSALNDNDAIKWRMRHLTMSLIENAMSLSDTSEIREQLSQRSFTVNVLEITALLEVSVRSGLISTMNASVVKAELERLLEDSQIGVSRNSFEKILTNRRFFKVSLPAMKQEKASPEMQSRYPTSSGKRMEMAAPSISNTPFHKGQSVEETSHTAGPPHSRTRVSDNISLGPLRDELSKSRLAENRKSLIISLFQGEKALTIKDISSAIKGYSAKTIQRELLQLISSGVLKRNGSRRWSTYSLAPSETSQ